MVGKQLGHYRILGRIGAGGMGEVYRAHDERLDREIALKVLAPENVADQTARARLLREARSAAALNHPHICTVYEVGEAEGQTYIAMELIEGQSLADCIQAKSLPAETAMRYGSQIAAALAHAHQRHIIHRDLKCANVVLTLDGRAKVLDFGLAKRQVGEELQEATTQSHAPLTQAGAAVGTLAYMSPEQLRGEPADARSDIWALGVMLYEMAAGLRPFRGQTGYQLSAAILNHPPAPPPGVPPELRAVIGRCLEKEPGQRYQSAAEVRAALEAVQTGTVPVFAGWRHAVARAIPQLSGWPAWAQRLFFVLLVFVVISTAVGQFYDAIRGFLEGWRSAHEQAVNPAKIESLAVLPVQNLTGDPEQEYFADGMTEELITEFSRVRAFKKVIPRSSVMRYKGTTKSLLEIAAELGVDAVVEAALLESVGQMRATVRLIDGATEKNLWADRFTHGRAEAPMLYGQVVSAIAKQLEVNLTAGEQARLARARAVNPEAYEAYLKGRYYISKLSAEANKTAVEYFRLALQKDAGYALAYAGIGMAGLSSIHMGFVPPREAADPAKEAILKALSLDDAEADAHEFLAGIHLYLEWDWAAAEREFQRTKELNPRNWACTSAVYADYLLLMGRRTEAVADMRRCLEANPLSFFVEAAFGGRLLRAGEREEGIRWLRKAATSEPALALAQQYLWYAHHQEQRFEEGLAEAQSFFHLKGYPEIAEEMKKGQREGGYAAAMQRAGDRLAEASKRKHVQPTIVAGLYAFAGDNQRALDWLDKAYEQRDSWLTFVKDDLRYLSLHPEPRFQELLRRLKIPQ